MKSAKMHGSSQWHASYASNTKPRRGDKQRCIYHTKTDMCIGTGECDGFHDYSDKNVQKSYS
jgi:hypothetical protein